MLSRITIVTGDTHDLVEAEASKLVKDNNWPLGNPILINFPESKKRAKYYTKELKARLVRDVKESFVIKTFSEDVLFLIGHMIDSKMLLREEAEIYIFDNNAVKKSTYDSDGFLVDYPSDYLSWSE